MSAVQRRGWRSRLASIMATVLVSGVAATLGATPSTAATVDTSAWYVLANRNSGKALDVYNVATNDGARITQWTRSNSANQQRHLVRVGSGEWPPSTPYTNPVVWQDFADIDIIRVGDTYYATASTMHYSPGAPILRSYDLVNWEFAGHAVPSLDFGSKYDVNGSRGYVRGAFTLNNTWQFFMGYRYGIFNHATQALGGTVTVRRFDLTTP
ncbi:family 43 glycosylhydrolase [Kibdelosporangium aridum]|uniref:family 43 glycosylhydrolase n=1 Tax=Kibdelosporangium aridum TaxID=2030 RepID=UPI0021ADF6BA|nr:family 43 glycosylhydrolase [Kibdelosporangium aridum]